MGVDGGLLLYPPIFIGEFLQWKDYESTGVQQCSAVFIAETPCSTFDPPPRGAHAHAHAHTRRIAKHDRRMAPRVFVWTKEAGVWRRARACLSSQPVDETVRRARDW